MGAIRQLGRRLAAGWGDRSAGFAAVDALVALTILSTTLVLALQAAATVRKTADAALEARRAEALLVHLMSSHRPAAGQWSGASGGLSWRLEVQPDGAAPASAVCRRQAMAWSDRSSRRYEFSTLEPCPIEGLA